MSALTQFPADDGPVTLERHDGPHGEVVLRRRAGDGAGAASVVFEIIENGCFLMDTSDGRSERLLVRAALDALLALPDAAAHGTPADGSGRAGGFSVLIGGLGVGFSLAEAAADPRWSRVTVVEREPAVVGWHRPDGGPLAPYSAHALADPRVTVATADLVAHLTGGDSPERWDALCLDIDNGPDWTVSADNDSLYGPAGLAACRARLTPGGVLAVWSAQPSAAFEAALRAAGFTGVRTAEVPVRRGVPDVVHLANSPA
jgi:spermidine synthase